MQQQLEGRDNRLHGLDHLRALAIILVMLFHYRSDNTPEWIEPVKAFGWTGVDLFFTLSGYLIGSALFKEVNQTNTVRVSAFYFKRFLRIIPPYIVVLISYYVFPILQEGRGLPPLWRFLTFTQNINLDPEHVNTFSHTWSLCIEEQFYLLLPVIIILCYKSGIRKYAFGLFIVLFVFEFTCRIYSWDHFIDPMLARDEYIGYEFLSKMYYPTYTRLDGLLIGLIIAGIVVFKPKLSQVVMNYGNVLFGISLILITVTYFVCDEFISYTTAMYGYTLVPVAYGFLVLAAISPSCFLYRLKSKITYGIATISYVLYLIHKQLYHITKMIFADSDISGGVLMVFCLLAAIAGGIVLHYVIEKPVMKLRSSLADSRINAQK